MSALFGLQLYEHICDEQECTDIGCSNPEIPATVLLKPEEYEIVDEARLPELVKLLSVGQLKGSPVGGLTFGVHVPEVKKRGQRVSYPSGPTWQVFSPLHLHWHWGRSLAQPAHGVSSLTSHTQPKASARLMASHRLAASKAFCESDTAWTPLNDEGHCLMCSPIVLCAADL